MKKLFIIALLLIVSINSNAQTAKDLLNSSDVQVRWLGVDYSHVKLIGDFSQFYGAGNQSEAQIRDIYFAGWNELILNEPNKYDIKGMLELSDIYYDVDMIMGINANANVDELASYNTPKYSKEDIEGFISSYKIEAVDEIGVLFVAESLNKNTAEAYYHFVAINMKTKEVLIHERMKGVPSGFGLRNYWAGSIYNVIKDIKKTYFKVWKNRLK